MLFQVSVGKKWIRTRGLTNGTKRQCLRDDLEVALATCKVADKVALAAIKAYRKAPNKVALAASDRATTAFLAALAALAHAAARPGSTAQPDGRHDRSPRKPATRHTRSR